MGDLSMLQIAIGAAATILVNVRAWAVEIINAYSGVKMPQATRQDLIKKVPLSRQAVVERFAERLKQEPSDRALLQQEFFTRMHLKNFGMSVSDLKHALNAAGYYDGEVGDAFSAELAAAIARFQRDHELKPDDGIYGPDTHRVLSSVAP